MDNALKRDLRRYPLYFLIWTVLGLFFFSQGLTEKWFSHDPNPAGGITCFLGSPESTSGLY